MGYDFAIDPYLPCIVSAWEKKWETEFCYYMTCNLHNFASCKSVLSHVTTAAVTYGCSISVEYIPLVKSAKCIAHVDLKKNIIYSFHERR